MSRGALLLAHGTPDSLDEMPDYLARVRGGRPPSAELVEEMRGNYAAIGGRSPLTDITRAQARALEKQLELPVFVGMRNWKPFVAEALEAALAAGVRLLVAIPMAPQYSTLSVGKYREAVEAARPPQLEVRFVESWHAHPDLIAAFAERLEEAIRTHAPDRVVFTAHSLPVRVVAGGDPYADQVAATAAAVAAAVGLGRFDQAWQSAGRTPEPWLAPSLEERLQTLAGEGMDRVLVAPIGFVCDHTEVLFDIDVQAHDAARRLGLELHRMESLNVSPRFVRGLAAIAREALESAA